MGKKKKDTEFVVKSLPMNKTTCSEDSTSEFYQQLKQD